MTHIIAHYRAVTPLFLGGAENTAEAELRPASIKGALRFWWRALQWGTVDTVAALKEKESDLFGSSEVREEKTPAGKTLYKGGQARFLLTITEHQHPDPLPVGDILSKDGSSAVLASSKPTDRVGDGARYLGYGLMEAFDGKNTKGGRLTRPCIAAPFAFTVRIAFRKDVGDQEIEEIKNALKLLGLCGGLGSRSRRGWGSLTLTKLENEHGDAIWNAPTTFDEFVSKIKEIVVSQERGGAGSLPEWTAFATGHSKVVLLQDSFKSPLETLAAMGRDFVFFRSNGRENDKTGNREVLNNPIAEMPFKADHDLMKHPNTPNGQHPARIVFGLPQNYTHPNSSVAPKDFDRRASPLFFHVHQVNGDDHPIGVLTFLPSVFLPAGSNQISVKGTDVPLGQNGEGLFWNPIEEFLQRIKSDDGKFQKTQKVAL
jgi:CRISPR-associated protein Cmr1